MDPSPEILGVPVSDPPDPIRELARTAGGRDAGVRGGDRVVGGIDYCGK